LNAFFTDTDTTHKTSSVNYAGTNSVTVTKDIKLTNVSSPPGLFDLSSVSNDFSLLGGTVPEPVTAVSIGLGLCILAIKVRKSSKKS
jgi:hypothetical protein